MTTKELLTSVADLDGFNFSWICFHVVSVPWTVVLLEAKVAPVEDRRDTVRVAVVLEELGKR